FGKTILKKLIDTICDIVQNKNFNICDIGTGNGHVINRLAKQGYQKLTGIDYSESAIELAKSQNVNYAHLTHFQVCDMVDPSTFPSSEFDVCIDKGTFDAILLSKENKDKSRQTYIQVLYEHLKSNGLFFIVSCNWTKNELIEFFLDKFTLEKQIDTPTMSFGGKQGNTVTFLVFRKAEHI
ncbi:unnamed protein product, partial [Didymodactylos carnosus]